MEAKKHLYLIDVCGGTGIGGIALTKVLMRKGVKVDLTILDLRESALNKAVEFGLREIGLKVEKIVMDVKDVHKLNRKYDVALLYGLTAAHFNPWEMTKILTSVSEIILDEGIFILDEVDRIQGITLTRGYQQILPETSEERIVITMHKDYDPITGEFHRLVVNLINREKYETKVYFWSLAELMNLLWIFFKDIDFISDPSRPHTGIIMAYEPRRKLLLEDFHQNPKIIRNLNI